MLEPISPRLRHAFGAPLPPRRDSALATKHRILLVEDDAIMARVLADNLTYEGFAVEWIPDGELLLEKVRTFSPDLVVLDVSLPRRDGFELCRMLRCIVQIPVLVFSARSQNADRRRGLVAGAADYVTKPFDLDDLMTRIRTQLRRHPHPTTHGVERVDLARVIPRRRDGIMEIAWFARRSPVSISPR